MTNIQTLNDVANLSSNHDGHIARSVIALVNQATSGSISIGQAKLQIATLLKKYELAADVENKENLFNTVRTVVKTHLLSL